MVIVVVLGLLSCLAALAFYQPSAVTRLAQRLMPDLVFYVPTTRAVVVLSLDDGPDPDVTPLVLDALKAHGVKATWFLIGERVAQFPALYTRILDEGHEVANHLWDETPAWRLSRDAFRASLTRTEAAVKQRDTPLIYRPASGWVRPSAVAEARRLGYVTVLGSAYTSDPLRPPRGYVRWALTRMARPGAILVLHVGPGRVATPAILPGIIRDIRDRGFEFVRLREMLRECEKAR